jgi:hypothetical protein
METKDRTKTEVSIELREVQREISKARSTRNWAKISFLNQKRIRLQEELDYLKSKDKFYYQEQNLEKSLVSWAAKTLNLSLNMADLSVYYLDLYLLHFKDKDERLFPGLNLFESEKEAKDRMESGEKSSRLYYNTVKIE